VKLVVGERLSGSHGGDHRTGEDGGTPVQVGQGRQGSRIGPVEVIEEQDEGGMGPPQPDERLERRHLRWRGLAGLEPSSGNTAARADRPVGAENLCHLCRCPLGAVGSVACPVRGWRALAPGVQ
jgi:hypothetical protein